MTVFIAGCLLGFSGAAHCAAMCGPLVLAQHPHDRERRRTSAIAAYHTGRILMYLLLSLPAGVLAGAVTLAGVGRGVAVLAGGVLLLMAAGVPAPAWIRRVEHAWCRLLSRARCRPARPQTRVVWGPLRAGVVNGLLPCGLVYPAALTGAALGDPTSTLLFMLGFGAGTLPAMAGLSYGLALVPSRLRRHLRRLTPAALTLTGVLLIAQGIAPMAGVSHPHVMTR